jgi:integrase
MPKPAMTFSKYQSFTIEPGLYIVEPKGGRTYQARARVAGKWIYAGTETGDYRAAEQFARKWFRQMQAGTEGHETLQQAASEFLSSVRDEGKRKWHNTKWEAIRQFWQPGAGRPAVLVSAVDTPKLVEFVKWRQNQSPGTRSTNARLSSNTLHKDLVTLRQIIKYAVARGIVPSVPDFPGAHIVGSIKSNPQPWLTKDEWTRLIDVANERIDAAPNVRTEGQRRELRDFLLFMHATGLRVDEARGLQVRDCTPKVAKTGDWRSIPMIALPPDYEQERRGVRKETIDYRRKSRTEAEIRVRLPYVEIRLRTSKTGPRICQSRAYADAILRRVVKGKAVTDPLFTEHHRDAFRELLIAADLRTNDYGHPRNLKCIRPTSISHWLIDRPTVPLSWLATNCGTSIQMLQDFYIKRLGLALDGSAWL